MVSKSTLNRPKQHLYKSNERLRRVQKQRRKKNQHQKTGAIPDKEIVPKGILKKRMTSSRANITLSSKKKRKILKRFRHAEAENSKMDVSATVVKPKKQAQKNKKKTTDQKMDCD